MTLNPSHPPGSIADLSGLASRLADHDRRLRVAETKLSTTSAQVDVFPATGIATCTFNAQPYQEAWVAHNMNAFPLFVVQPQASNSLFWGVVYFGILGYPDGNTVRFGFGSSSGDYITGAIDFKWAGFVP